MKVHRASVCGDARGDSVPLDRRIYGQNLEFMARQFAGGIQAERGSRAPVLDRDLRADVREALIDLGVNHLRWPGGCFADVYDWRAGVGHQRATSPNAMWGDQKFRELLLPPDPGGMEVGPDVDNRFGTAEFLELCNAMRAEASLTASMGTPGPDLAAEWVAYVRDHFGPGAVPVWYVGNEQFSRWEHNGCHGQPERYVERYHTWTRAMRHENPEIRFVASGGDETFHREWNRVLLDGIGTEADYFSVHTYLPFFTRDGAGLSDSEADHLAAATAGLCLEQNLRACVEHMQAVLGEVIPISLDEWNVLGSVREFVTPVARMREAIAVAGILHAIHRLAATVKIADQFAAVNGAAPPILTDTHEMARTPVYHVFQLYSQRSLAGIAPLRVSSPCYDTDAVGLITDSSDVPFLDASLSTGSSGCALFLINRHPSESLLVEVEIDGVGIGGDSLLETVSGFSHLSSNQPGRPDEVVPESHHLGWPEAVELPPCSVSALTTASPGQATAG
ncbi:MAG: Intracellular exo-alpha-L-arabinofuranosidase 2 [Acidimicrobiaceae bacterium]|nr:Intracellular exo-alpha-L-arabinofuranosidase 2 [Acidimicrobiaceae bacterium]